MYIPEVQIKSVIRGIQYVIPAGRLILKGTNIDKLYFCAPRHEKYIDV